MLNTTLLRKLYRDLWARKGPLIALLLIVMIGVGVFIGSGTVYMDLDGARARYYTTYRLADFSVNGKRFPPWSVERLAELQNVRSVRGRVYVPVRIQLPAMGEPLSGTAISMPFQPRPVLNDLLLKSGTWFSGRSEREVILNEAFARANHLRPGDRIKVLLLDKEHDLLIVGTGMSPEFIYLMAEGSGFAPDPERFGVLYLPEPFLQEAADLQGAYNQVLGLAHDTSRGALENTLRLIEERLDPYGVTQTTPVEDLPSARFLSDELMGLKVTATVIPAIFLGVAALILNVMLGRLVHQQRTVIGTLKALGYSSWAVTRHYLTLGLIIGSMGGLCGASFGLWMQHQMLDLYGQFYPMPDISWHFYPIIFVEGMAVSIGFALLGTIKGVRTAARLMPAEAMRPPAPEKGGRIFPEHVTFLWRPLPFRWKLILRSIFRNPFRSGVNVLAGAISTALVVAVLNNVDALDVMMRYEFEQVSHQDVTLSLRDPKGQRGPAELARLPSVSQTEPQLQVACDLTHGPRRRRVSVIGLPRNNQLYTPLDSAGHAIVLPSKGLILSKKLAEIMDCQPGDVLLLRPLVGRRMRVRAAVAGTVDTFMGLSAYADLDYLARLLGEEGSANVLLARSFERETSERFLKEVRKRPTVLGVGRRTRALTQIQDTFGETMGIMITMMVFFAGLIAFGSVLNSTLVSLNERQRDVGTLRVLGYTPQQVGGIFAGESLLLYALGIGLGLVGGIGLSYLLAMAYDTELYRFPVVITIGRLAQAAVIMVVCIGLAQLIILRIIHTLDWKSVLNVRE